MSSFSLVCFVWKISSVKVQLSTNDIKRVWRYLGVFGLSIAQYSVLKILAHISFFILYFSLHIPNDVFGSNISFRNSFFFFFLVKWRFSNSLICISIYIYIYIGTLFTWPFYWNLEVVLFHMYIYIGNHWNLEVVLFLNWCVFSKIGYKDLSLQEIEGFARFFILPIKPVFDLFLKLESISWKNNQSRIWLNISEELKVLHLNWLWVTHKVFDRIL